MTEIQEQRHQLADKIPELGIRVFALKGKHYRGYGFHWSMMRTLGSLLSRINDYDKRFSGEDLVLCEVLYEELVEQVTAAEASLQVR